MDAAIALLCEGGWQAVTTRGVAERADTNAGLIHYHFGGLPGLHAAIVRRVGELVINPLVTELLDAPDEWAALAAVRRLLPETTGDERTARLSAELLAGATRDPALGEVLRDQLREARTQIAGRIRQLHPGWPPERATAVATLVAALIDGLVLHHMLDQDLPVGEALAGVEDLLRKD